MTLRPCLVCGEPSAGPRCAEHTVTDTRVRKAKGQAAHDPVWRKLSTKARKQQPWCQDCGAREDLTADHVIPKSLAPELVHAIENLIVRCRSCNSRRGATGFTGAEAAEVIARLQSTYRRRPTRAGRERIAAAENALTRGDAPAGGPPTPSGRQSSSYTPAEAVH